MKFSISPSQLTRSQRLMLVIGKSFSFFVAEIGGEESNLHHVTTTKLNVSDKVGFTTRSLALIADAFHYVR